MAARDLYLSDTVKLRANLVRGILTQEGGVTSHVSILAKSMDIPILVGVEGILSEIEDEMLVCMDAEKGTIVIDPDREEWLAYQSLCKCRKFRRDSLCTGEKHGWDWTSSA